MKGVYMKKLLSILLITVFSIFNLNNINATTAHIVMGTQSGIVEKVDNNGNLIWSYNHGTNINDLVIDNNNDIHFLSGGNYIKLNSSGQLQFTISVGVAFAIYSDLNNNFIYIGLVFSPRNVLKYDLNGNILQTFNSGHTGEIYEIDLDSNNNIYTASQDGTIRKHSNTGTFISSFTPATSQVLGVKIIDNNDILTGNLDNTFKKFNSSFTQQWSVTPFTNSAYRSGIALDSLGNIYHGGKGIYKRNSSGGLIWQVGTTNVFDVEIDDNDNIYVAFTADNLLRKLDTNGNIIWSVAPSTGADKRINAIAIEPPIQIQYPLQINLDSNYDPFADIVYQSDFLTTTSSIVNDILLSASQVEISTNQSNISPFVFQHWFDLDNNNIYTTSRTFTISNPDRDYNLRAIYDLTNSIELSLDSNLPAPPNFNVEVDTIEQQRATISKYPLIDEEIPFGYNFEVEAPDVSQISFYEFDYWFDNINNRVFTTSAIISLDALENYDLTATYSLPAEYQIVLTLFSNIGDITFKLGNQPAITGSFIEVTIGQNDSWTASGPLNPDWQFQNWTDLETNQIFSINRSIGISNTSKNYILEALYWPIYDVNWNSLGGTLIAPQRIVSGGTINAPVPDPIRPNFAFDGWALPSAPSTPITFPQIVNDNVTYQAIWLNTFNLTFNENGGQQVPDQIIIENDTPTVVTPSRFGYTFDGWYTDNLTFNNLFNFNAPFTQNTTIHAKWTFGTSRDAGTSFDNFLTDAGLNDAFSKWIIVLVAFIVLNVIIFIYKGPFIVTTVLNFILTALFIVLGFIPIWIIIIIFIALFGFGILMFTGGRS
jgi:uncharacterized repeat protein (TIGR02543 family)